MLVSRVLHGLRTSGEAARLGVRGSTRPAVWGKLLVLLQTAAPQQLVHRALQLNTVLQVLVISAARFFAFKAYGVRAGSNTLSLQFG